MTPNENEKWAEPWVFTCSSDSHGGVVRCARAFATFPLALLVVACGIFSSVPEVVAQTFRDVSDEVGINHNQTETQPEWFEFSEPRIMSGGAAARDYDNDGFLDLIFTCIDAAPVLYRNQGDGTFEVVDSSTSGITVSKGANGASWGDVNNDGHADLYISTIVTNRNSMDPDNRNRLYVNNGDGTFTEQAVERSVDLHGKGPGYSTTFGDYDNDGYLDLYTTAWSDIGGVGMRLLQNEGASNPGHFTDETVAAGVEMAQYTNYQGIENMTFGFSPRFSDLDADGDVDLAIASDFGTSRLFWNNGDGTFTDGRDAAGIGIDNNGMGSAIGDYDGDGDLDWFVSSIWDEDIPPNAQWMGNGSQLYTNNGDGTFEATAMDTYWGWGSAFFDYDNDGRLDLAVTNGFDVPHEISHVAEFFEDRPTLLYHNNGDGTFTDVTFDEGVFHFESGKGLLTGDFNNDGKLELVVVSNGQTDNDPGDGITPGVPDFYLNELDSDNDWIGFDTVGAVSNADGFGAKITITIDGVSQLFEVNGGSNFLAQSDKRAHFGLGETDGIVDLISIVWPSGITQEFYNVEANYYYTINELEGLSLTYAAIPEPSSIVLGTMAVAGLSWAGYRRHRSRKANRRI